MIAYFILLAMVPIVLLIVLLTVLGTVGNTGPYGMIEPPIKSCLYIGLPITFYILFTIIYLGLENKPLKLLHATRNGIIWNKCPYIIWILFTIAKYLVNLLLPTALIIIITLKILRTITIIFTMADGKAENRIDKIWTKNG
jgi:hypothetical protein